MPNRGAVAAPEPDLDVTGEIPLVGEDEVPAQSGRRTRRRRFTLIGLAVVLILATAIGLTLGLTGGSPAPGLVVTDSVVSVTTGTMEQTVASSGTIEPASQASLNFAVSGTVTAVNVAAGQTVTAGQVLATVGTTALQDQLDAAQAQLAGRRRHCRATTRRAPPPLGHRLGPGGGDLGPIGADHGPDQPQRRLVVLDHLGHRGLGEPDCRATGRPV